MQQVYEIETANSGEVIEIAPNYDDYRKGESDRICFSIMNGDDCNSSTSIDIEQAKDLINKLNEVITYIEYAPKVGDWVNVIGGKFNGFSGKIYDIDEVASKREATIEIPKTQENEKFYIFVNLNDVDIIRQ
jgi:transcription antitermination factor NusG